MFHAINGAWFFLLFLYCVSVGCKARETTSTVVLLQCFETSATCGLCQFSSGFDLHHFVIISIQYKAIVAVFRNN